MQASWSPDMQNVQQLVSLFELSLIATDSNSHKIILQKLSLAEKHPEYSCYLSFILSRMPTLPLQIRHSAGLSLKNYFSAPTSTGHLASFAQNNPSILSFVQNALLAVLCAVDEFLRDVAAFAADSVLRSTHLSHWPDLLSLLSAWLSSDERAKARGALSVLAVAGQTLQSQNEGGAYDTEFDELVPLVLKAAEWGDAKDSARAVEALTEFACFRSDEVKERSGEIVGKMVKIAAKWGSAGEKTLFGEICRFFEVLTGYREEKISGAFLEMNGFVLSVLENGDEWLRVLACAYFNAYFESFEEFSIAPLKPYLERLLLSILKSINYDDSMCQIISEEQEKTQFDDLLPNNSADSDTLQEWALRSLAANAFESLVLYMRKDFVDLYFSVVFGKAVLESDWKTKEAINLTLGLLSEFKKQIEPQTIEKILIYLLKQIKSESCQFLAKSTALWSLSNYADFLYSGRQNPNLQILEIVLKQTQSPIVRLQQSSCSAFAALLKSARRLLLPMPFFENAAAALWLCFENYQHPQSVRFCLSALVDLGLYFSERNTEKEAKNLVFEPLMAKNKNIEKSDTKKILLVEAMAKLFPFLLKWDINASQSFLQEVSELFGFHFPNLDKNLKSYIFIEGVLNFLSDVLSAVDKTSAERIINHQTFEIAFFSAKCNDASVKQSAFMLIGLMAQKSPVFVNFVINSIKKIKFKQNFENFVPLCLPNLSTISDKILFNNANWCLGELSIIVPHSVEICINEILNQQINALKDPLEREDPVLSGNVSMTLGRLFQVCPKSCLGRLDEFGNYWMDSISSFLSCPEKTNCLKTLFSLVRYNAKLFAANHMESLCRVIVNLNQNDNITMQEVKETVSLCQSSIGLEMFQTNIKNFPPYLVQSFERILVNL